MEVIYVALGGALGAAGRYLLGCLPLKTLFPFNTLLINILGAILIGFIVGLAVTPRQLSPQATFFWKAGVCGGFTTFSTFSLETMLLFEEQHYFQATLYIVLSVVGCLVGVYLGKRLAQGSF